MRYANAIAVVLAMIFTTACSHPMLGSLGTAAAPSSGCAKFGGPRYLSPDEIAEAMHAGEQFPVVDTMARIIKDRNDVIERFCPEEDRPAQIVIPPRPDQ